MRTIAASTLLLSLAAVVVAQDKPDRSFTVGEGKVTFTAAEVRNPRRNLPLALALGAGTAATIS